MAFAFINGIIRSTLPAELLIYKDLPFSFPMSNMAINQNLTDKYLENIVHKIMKTATPSIASHYEEIATDFKEFTDFDSHADGQTDYSFTLINYNSNQQKIHLHFYNINPSYNESVKRNRIRITSGRLEIPYTFAKDWMIIAKSKARLFKALSYSELQYIDEKKVDINDISKAIANVFQYAYELVSGLQARNEGVRLPERYFNVITNICEQNMANPSPGIIRLNEEQKQMVLEGLQKIRELSSKPTGEK